MDKLFVMTQLGFSFFLFCVFLVCVLRALEEMSKQIHFHFESKYVEPERSH